MKLDMKKRVFGRHFSRSQKGRKALLRSLLREFLLRGEITTTETRVKTMKPVIDRLVTLAKKGSLAGKRRLLALFANGGFPVEALGEALPRFIGLNSGFTKTLRVRARGGDAAPLVKIMWSREKPVKTQGSEQQETGKKKQRSVRAKTRVKTAKS